MTNGLHDPSLLAGLGDSQLRGAFGTLGEGHDLLAKLVITGLCSQFGQRLPDVGRLHFAPVSRR